MRVGGRHVDDSPRLAVAAWPRLPVARAAAADARSGALASGPSVHVRRGLATGFRWLGAGVEPATDDGSGRCSTRLSYPVEAIQECSPFGLGLRPAAAPRPTLRVERTWHPVVRSIDGPGIHRFQRRGMAGTDRLGARVPSTGGVHEPLACERSPWSADSVAHGLFSSGAILLAGARPATRARRRGWAGLRAERPRSCSAHTAGTPAACALPPACGRPCGRCTGRRP